MLLVFLSILLNKELIYVKFFIIICTLYFFVNFHSIEKRNKIVSHDIWFGPKKDEILESLKFANNAKRKHPVYFTIVEDDGRQVMIHADVIGINGTENPEKLELLVKTPKGVYKVKYDTKHHRGKIGKKI